ncbi:hypothetical protein HY009_01160 [Candidatus Acetothermia bacterium]|nr:hypothetical protein [Candidatus Acetothermia bacterium]
MEIQRTHAFERDYRKLPHDVKRRFDKTIIFLVTNPKHPSLRAKIIDQTHRVWQARVTGAFRLYFTVDSGVITLHRVYDPHE